MKINWKKLVLSLLIPLVIGGIAGLITSSGMQVFSALNKPPLSPPGILFPFVWTVLYTLMGISFYLIWTSAASPEQMRRSFILYAAQLLVNFLWPIFFFNAKIYAFAFGWLVLLWIMILLLILNFSRTSKPAAALQIPYLLWVTFAGYLNLSIALLN